MTEQQRPDEDVEGHRVRFREDPEGVEDDVEGHKHILEEGSADDVAGHQVMWKQDEAASEDDVEGHRQRPV